MEDWDEKTDDYREVVSRGQSAAGGSVSNTKAKISDVCPSSSGDDCAQVFARMGLKGTFVLCAPDLVFGAWAVAATG